MTACKKRQRNIVWLSMDALDEVQAKELKAHLQTCLNCRRYLAELAARKLACMDPGPEVQAAPQFRPTFSSALKADAAPGYVRASQKPNYSLSSRRPLLLQTVFAVAIAVLIVTAMLRHTASVKPSSMRATSIETSEGNDVVLPTFANYRAVANQSLDQFDSLITRQSRKPIPPAPVFSLRALDLNGVPD
jgi:hypothetical protein